jgi:putative endonuclease
MAAMRDRTVRLHPSVRRTRIYVGATSNLIGRIIQHRRGAFEGHTKKYGIVRLVYFETADTMEAAFAYEKKLKRWRREWKRNLIERQNPAWNYLAAGFGLGPPTSSPSGAVDPGTSPG